MGLSALGALASLAALGLAGCGEDMPGPSWSQPSPDAIRADLTAFIYRDGVVPDAPPDAVTEDIRHELFVDVPNLRQIDVLRFDLDFGLWSKMYQFWPEDSNGHLILYNVGHGHTLSGGDHAVIWLIERGYTVVFVFMPLFGENPANVNVEYEGETYWLRAWHGDLAPIEERGGNVFHLFFEPLARMFTHATEAQGFSQLTMMGLSGGGWTTDVYSAIDPRVKTSYSISGSVPFRLRTSPRDLGEYEQLGGHPFYDLVDYMGLYFLSAQGEGQRHRQLAHEFDDCCYAWGGRADAFRHYEASVRARLERDPVGGDFRIHLIPDLVDHNVHIEDLEIIDRELSETRE